MQPALVLHRLREHHQRALLVQRVRRRVLPGRDSRLIVPLPLPVRIRRRLHNQLPCLRPGAFPLPLRVLRRPAGRQVRRVVRRALQRRGRLDDDRRQLEQIERHMLAAPLAAAAVRPRRAVSDSVAEVHHQPWRGREQAAS